MPFGEVADEDVIYSTNAGARASKHLFEPPDSAKGIVARALFYFYTSYRRRYHILPREFVDPFWNDSLPTLMRWNIENPPGSWEMERNRRTQVFQGNRNPFVDNYLLVERIGLDAFRFSPSS